MHAEALGDLADREQAAGAQSFGVAWEAVGAAQVEHDLGAERLAGARAVVVLVELGGDPCVGVLVEEAVDEGEGVGVGLARLPCAERDGDRQVLGLAAAETDVELDLLGAVDGDVLDHSRAIRLRSRCGVAGSDHSAGKSVAGWRMRALCSSSSAAWAAALARW